jgi:serine/threonine-protein phosphatase 2A regulatory subunit A
MLQRLVPLVDAAVAEHTIKPCLLELAEDPDVDVRFFAQQALHSCEVVTAA